MYQLQNYLNSVIINDNVIKFYSQKAQYSAVPIDNYSTQRKGHLNSYFVIATIKCYFDIFKREERLTLIFTHV